MQKNIEMYIMPNFCKENGNSLQRVSEWPLKITQNKDKFIAIFLVVNMTW